MKNILTINIGSSSKKYSFFQNGNLKVFSHYEKEEKNFILTKKIEEKEEKRKISEKEYNNSSNLEIEFLKEKFIKNEKEISAVGFRVVCPGNFFLERIRKIDKNYLEKLEEGFQLAPLHIKPILREIKEFKSNFPDILSYGISDSSFFKDIPIEQKYYAIPKELSDKYDIKRFGYHGISAQSILRKIQKEDVYKNIIICHLGSGASVIAVKNGKAFTSSMGFTPLEGLVMATRSGDIDFGVISYLSKKENLNFEEMNTLLNEKSGLIGLSKTNDMREIIERKENDKQADLAYNIFINRIKKYIGGFSAQLGGLDILIFTGTIGERSDIVRESILENMEFLSIYFNKEKNEEISKKGIEGSIEEKNSKVKIQIIKTDEMREMKRMIEEEL
jgi:acetate kinase